MGNINYDPAERCIHNELLRTEPGKGRKNRRRKDQSRCTEAVCANNCVCERARQLESSLPHAIGGEKKSRIFLLSSSICTLSVYCSLLKTGRTAGKPVAIFRAQQNSVCRAILTEHNKAEIFPLPPTLKLILLSPIGDVMSPTAGSDTAPALRHASLAVCCKARSICQSLDRYSFRCVKECLRWGNYGWVTVDSHPQGLGMWDDIFLGTEVTLMGLIAPLSKK